MKRTISLLAALAVTVTLSACGGGGDDGSLSFAPAPPGSPAPALGTGPATCAGGTAGGFPCLGVDLRARVPHTAMGGSIGNDIWGWADATTGREYALVGQTNGTAFVDVTDPEAPVYLGRLPAATVASIWRDIKVYDNHAYIVADDAGQHGLQVFDLTRLRGVSAAQTFSADVIYSDFGSAHNIAINEQSGFAYVVGISSGMVTCDESLHMIDLATPNNPLFAGCHSGFDVHDAQCVDYTGPDPDHAGAEICFNFAANAFEVADVSVKSSPVTLSAIAYPGLRFVHQGWVSEDQRFAFVGDEVDEIDLGAPTRTIVLDISDLDNPTFVYTYEAATRSIDHNMYVLGNLLLQANYTSGLRIIEFTDPAAQDLTEIAFFDTHPQSDGATFDGAWSVYPYLPSGNLIVNDDANGLFVLTMP